MNSAELNSDIQPLLHQKRLYLAAVGSRELQNAKS